MTEENSKKPVSSGKLSNLTSALSGAKKLAQSNGQTAKPEKPRPTKPEKIILPAVPIREGVLFPSTESVLTFGRQISLAGISQVTQKQNAIVLITQKQPRTDDPKPTDLYDIGTLALVDKKIKTEDSINALVRGVGRVRILRYIQLKPKILVEVVRLADMEEKDEESVALANHLQKEFRKAVHMGKPVEFLNFMKLMGGVTDGELTDQIASTLTIDTTEKQQILETLNVKSRMKLVIDKLAHEMKVLEIEKDVVSKTQKKFDKSMRESVLRERLRTIQKELGEIEDEEEIVDEYETKLTKLKVDKETKTKITKELRRLKQMSPNNPEAGYIRTWLDTVFELPFGRYSKTSVSISQAERSLEKSHFGLEKVKDRILEYIAVLQLKQKTARSESDRRLPTILCFVGPPGVGKTSIGKSIAESLKRKFVKVSLGGIRDEAEIRGHRRTYVGAMPGRIISGIRQAGSMNPIFMLDEIDKIGADFRGDPSAALLEALDPEQNNNFEDHYLDIRFDLSEVIFITTANTLDTIPPALRDRLEVIRYSGYTEEEKFQIAKQHLLEKVRSANGLTGRHLSFTDAALRYIIERYTREAGVRDLERNLHKIMRKVARQRAESGKHSKISITPKKVREFLGPEKFDIEFTSSTDVVGQATGLAWTTVGGDTLFVEVALTPGKSQVKLTGKLGEVMKESAQAAYTYVKANADKYGISAQKITKTDIHVHVPEGAVPKDGPSAGVTIVAAIISAFTNIPVRRDVAMTGEVTLRGRVLRIGGLKEKSLAAQRAGTKTILIPKTNERDLEEIPTTVTNEITFIPVEQVDEVIKHALTRLPKVKTK